MIQLNPQYEAIFDTRNKDEDCNKIVDEISDGAWDGAANTSASLEFRDCSDAAG